MSRIVEALWKLLFSIVVPIYLFTEWLAYAVCLVLVEREEREYEKEHEKENSDKV